MGISKNILLSPHDFADYICDRKISVLFLTTALFNQLASLVPQAFKNLRYLLFGGEAVDPRWVKKVHQEAPPQQLIHVYGPTESTTFSSWYLVQEITEGATTIPIGCPITNTQFYILDSHLQPAPIGVPGELYIGGDGLARGYLNRPELTEEKFILNPFSNKPEARLYKTGDLVRYLSDGNIEFIGRIDNQVKIRGFRIELGEIEALLAEHPQVREVVVIAREDIPDYKRLVAYVIPEQDQTPILTDLCHFLKQKLPEYMVPSVVVTLDTLPLTPNGKVDRCALPAPEDTKQEQQETFVSPRDELEMKLTKIWEKVLGIHPIGVKSKFFNLGGHSLLAVRLVAEIETAFHKKLPLVALSQLNTVEQLANILRQEETSESVKTSQPVLNTTTSQIVPQLSDYEYRTLLAFTAHLNQPRVGSRSLIVEIQPGSSNSKLPFSIWVGIFIII